MVDAVALWVRIPKSGQNVNKFRSLETINLRARTTRNIFIIVF